jgi:isoleucyl-tRNA synthetase
MFQPVSTNVNFPRLEEEILQWWNERDVVARSLASGEKPFVFYEGPPTANGRPGLHHVISRSFKDIILRYRAMQGYKIIGRREGWDTHGLPVEIEVEKKLGFAGKPDIERYGIAEFNKRCRESVWEYIQEWKTFTQRIAYWVSDDAYITYDNKYIESTWWIFRQLWDRGLLFRDYKVTMHCPRCGTSLSDHEVSQGSRDDVDDPSVSIKFVVNSDGPLNGAALVAWTTTPWTLPANVGLAVKGDAEYSLVEHNGQRLIMASALLASVLPADSWTVLQTLAGSSLVGLRYQRLYDGVPGAGDTPDLSTAYRVVADEMVSLDDGTGIVHFAAAYGDLDVCKKHGLPTLFSVGLDGNMLADFGSGVAGMFFKQADPLITRNLKERGLLLKSGRVKHHYPFCWRCSTPLLFFAKPSWYIRTTAHKDDLVANNQQIHWVPEHVRDGRFGNWLANNIDWAISRERYWGTPLPIWSNEDGSHTVCIGSLAELEAKVGRSLKDLDLHRPYVDDLTWEEPGFGTMRRIPDVADCWFDSGSMPVAQWHYPFENEALFESAHPADYICEAVDQTRGWFYTLHALSTLLFDRPAFNNVICLGHILDEHGAKMSKSKGNVVQPADVFSSTGVDALRWYLFSSAPPGNPRRFSLGLVNESLRKFMLTLWNSYSFFVTYANLDGWTPDNGKPAEEQDIDRWALAALNQLIADVTAGFEEYDVYPAARKIEQFVDELSNWYVRRNRRRFWKSEGDADKEAAYRTLYTCLLTVSKLAAPYIPFISESIYRNLTANDATAAESVHLARWPSVDRSRLDAALVADTAALLNAVSLGRAARKVAGVKVRQPLSELWLHAGDARAVEGVRRFESDLRDELNVKAVRYLDAESTVVEYRFKPNLRLLGKKLGKQVPAVSAALQALNGDAARRTARAVEAGEPVTLEVAGQPLTLEAAEVLVESSAPAGYAVSEGDGMLVALNTAVDAALLREGTARDLVRGVQDARKSAGYAISDRIRLWVSSVDAAELLQATLAEYAEYLCSETLAVALNDGPLPADGHRESVELAEGSADVLLQRA